MLGSVYRCGPCPYLADKEFRVFIPQPDSGHSYRTLMDHGFRRNGDLIYHTHCDNCNACSATRTSIAGFKMKKDQRRCWKRNQDLQISVTEISNDQEHRALFSAYEAAVHTNYGAELDHLIEHTLSTIEPAHSNPDTAHTPHSLEIQARDANGRLLAVTIIDVFGDAISSVYCYYDVSQRQRGLGTFMVLQEIDYCRQQQLTWLYLGFYVAACNKLAYKARFGPLQILHGQQWQWFDPSICGAY